MTSRSAILVFIAGGAFQAPLSVWGHACEFLVARMETGGGLLRLEITADHGGNPLLPDEEAAIQAVQEVVQIWSPSGPQKLAELAPLRIEKRTQWDLEAPASFSPPPDGTQHQLVTGLWEWRPDGREVVLSVQKGGIHDVLLWTLDHALPGRQARWMLLIEGEKTPPILIPASSSRFLWMAALLVPMLLLLGKRMRARTQAAMGATVSASASAGASAEGGV
jgi:hypothetical protein